MPADPCWIGIDLGTQSVRCLAVDGDGGTLAAAAHPLRSRRHGERHEQDPALWWSATATAIAEVTARLDGHPVGAVAVDSTSGTITVVDARGRPCETGLMYDDARASAFVAPAAAAGAEVWSRHGYRIQASWALPKLLWLIAERRLGPGRRLAHQADVVTAHLVGHGVATDASHALKTGYDQLRREWPQSAFAALGIDPAWLPEVVPAGTPLGAVGNVAARETGLAAGTPVIAGMTDGCAAQLGAGTVRPGSWNSVLGTTLTLKGVSDRLLHDPGGSVYSHRAPDGMHWLPGGASSTGAGALARLLPGTDLAALTPAAAAIAEPAQCYPLPGRGERFPFLAPEAEGFVVVDGSPEPLTAVSRLGAPGAFAAIAHGVACVERLAFEVLRAAGATLEPPLTLTGGGTRNPWWNALRCDLLGVPVRLVANAEPALGMALLAARSVGAERDVVAVAERMTRTRLVLEPSAERHERLGERYAAFVDALAERGWVGPTLAGRQPA